MAALDQKSFPQLLQDQTAIMQGRSDTPLDFSEGAVLRALIEANGGVGLWLQAEILKVLATTRAATSTGSDLDSFVQDYGLFRLGAQSATGTVTFSRFTPSAQAVIPVGATVQTNDGLETFEVIADTSNSNFNVGLNGYVLGAGLASIDVPVEAVTPGAGGNVAAGFIGLITSQLNYVDQVTNAASISGGGDAESDASLRARFVGYIQSLSRGTVQAIQFAVQSVRLGIQASVLENQNADLTTNNGFLCITVATSDLNPIPDSVTLSKAYAQADAYRAGGTWIGVFPPNLLLANVTLSLILDPQYDPNVLIGNVATTVTGYLNGLKIGQPLFLSKLTQVAIDTSPGVLSVSVATINRLVGDYIVTKRDIIRAGVVSVVGNSLS